MIIQLPLCSERTNSYRSWWRRRFRIPPRIEFRASCPRGRVDPCDSRARRSFERERGKKGGKNDSSYTSERTYGRTERFDFRPREGTKQGTGRRRGGRTRILIKNNSHAGRSLPGPTHPPLPSSAFRQLRERPSDPPPWIQLEIKMIRARRRTLSRSFVIIEFRDMLIKSRQS